MIQLALKTSLQVKYQYHINKTNLVLEANALKVPLQHNCYFNAQIMLLY